MKKWNIQALRRSRSALIFAVNGGHELVQHGQSVFQNLFLYFHLVS